MQAYPVELPDLFPNVAFSQRDIDHRRLDVCVPHRLHDGERVGNSHGQGGGGEARGGASPPFGTITIADIQFDRFAPAL